MSMTTAAHFCFYRTLYSQSAASVTVGMCAAVTRAAGRTTELTLLEKGEHRNGIALLAQAPDDAVLFLKPNFQDAAESLWLVDAIARQGVYRGVFLIGIYASGNADELLELLPHIDGVVEGEPEAVIPLLLDAVDRGDWRQAPPPGTLVRGEDTKPLRGTGRPPVLDLSTGLRPVRDVEARETARIANLEASRGCVASCTFCHVPVVDKAVGAPRRRTKSPAAVAAEAAELLAMGKSYLVFNDPLFWSGPRDTDRVRQIAEELRALGPGLNFMVYLRTRPFPEEELLAALAEAGLVRVFIGVESNSPEALKLYRKGTHRDEYTMVKERMARHGISHHIGFLMFNPFSTPAQIRHDLRYLAGHGQLHRIGVILERSRLVPRTQLLADAGRDLLLDQDRDPFSGDAAYSWRFQDAHVGMVHQCLEQALRRDFGDRQKFVEYYHTSSEFLGYLARRSSTPPPQEWWSELSGLHTELSDLVLGYGLGLWDAAREVVADAPDRGAPERPGAQQQVHRLAGTANFVSGLRHLERRTEAAAGLLFRRMRKAGHGELIDSLFTSAEGAR